MLSSKGYIKKWQFEYSIWYILYTIYHACKSVCLFPCVLVSVCSDAIYYMPYIANQLNKTEFCIPPTSRRQSAFQYFGCFRVNFIFRTSTAAHKFTTKDMLAVWKDTLCFEHKGAVVDPHIPNYNFIITIIKLWSNYRSHNVHSRTRWRSQLLKSAGAGGELETPLTEP